MGKHSAIESLGHNWEGVGIKPSSMYKRAAGSTVEEEDKTDNDQRLPTGHLALLIRPAEHHLSLAWRLIRLPEDCRITIATLPVTPGAHTGCIRICVENVVAMAPATAAI